MASSNDVNRDFLNYWSIEKPVFAEQDPGDNIYVPRSKESLLKRVKLYCERKGALVLLTAPNGHGKTTLARWLYRSLAVDRFEAMLLMLYKTETKAGWLLPRIGEFLGVAKSQAQPMTMQELLVAISQAMTELNSEGKQLTIIIDEAQKLSTTESFEEIHALVSMQTAIDIGVNVILLGSTELDEKIKVSPAVMSRIALHADYLPLTYEETYEYISFQLSKAGLDQQVVTEDARRAMFEMSGGVYGLIDILGDNCLLECFLDGTTVVNHAIVEKAAGFLAPLKKQSMNLTQGLPLNQAGAQGQVAAAVTADNDASMGNVLAHKESEYAEKSAMMNSEMHGTKITEKTERSVVKPAASATTDKAQPAPKQHKDVVKPREKTKDSGDDKKTAPLATLFFDDNDE